MTVPDPFSDSDNPTHRIPPVRRPVLFYLTVLIAFGLLGVSVLVILS